MADSKITQLNENTAAARADLLAIVDDPSGSAETQKITIANLLDKLSTTLAALGAAPAGADELIVIDDVSGTATAKTLLVSNLFTGPTMAGLTMTGFLNLNLGAELTIATGAITVTQSFHEVDTESDAASDDLDTINGGAALGNILVLRTVADARDVVVKHNTGNILLDGGADFTLSDRADLIMLMYNKSKWCEISRSNNT